MINIIIIDVISSRSSSSILLISIGIVISISHFPLYF